jgi:proline iminopeptidase
MASTVTRSPETNRLERGPTPVPGATRSELARRLGVAAIVAVGFGVGSVLLTPRGPVTSGEALVTMASALAVGVLAGFFARSRWVFLIAPVAFIASVELLRIGLVGPTVDAISVGSMYGWMALILGRGLHGLLAIVPMLLGALAGLWLGGRTDPSRSFGWTAGILAAVATAGLVALAVSIARPASTADILGGEGGGIAEIVTVSIGGHDQTMLIRGRDIDNPVLLYLAGGPGGTDLGAIRRDLSLEEDFVVVAWDQRGAGKSYASLDPVDTFTLDQLVADTIEVTDYLRDRFAEDRVYLVGQSWGSTLGALAVQQRPELFHAFVGVGQMVSQRASDIMFWEDTLAWAEASGETGLATTLRDNGAPPYENINDYEPVVAHEHSWNSYPELDMSNEMPSILFVPEYSFMDRVNAFRGFFDTAAVLYPQLQGLDFRADIPALGVPYYMVLGEHEARGRAVPAEEWFSLLDAPHKERVIFDGSGHRANFDRPGLFAEVMEGVLADTRGG